MQVSRIPIAVLLVILCAIFVASAQDGQTPSQKDLDYLAGVVFSEPRFAKYYKMCAADAFGSEQSYFNSLGLDDEITEEQCQEDVRGCFSKCVAGNGEACFQVARVFEVADREPYAGKFSQSAFALACAAGYHAGCTNRGSGMRPGIYDSDPARQWPDEKTYECSFRSFKAACPGDNGWGCVMLGEAYLNGIGIQTDRRKAKEAFNHVCDDSGEEDYGTCDMAKAHLQELR